ncbi:MAG: hypothetical protein KDJ87_16875 [Rhizobiaceae bacterium]|nr:hypothetical protein [Rhizobiaceae bacterium]
MKRLALAVVLVSASPLSVEAGDAFKNLPGVKDPAAEKEAQVDPACTSRLVKPWPSATPRRNGLAYRSYACEDGDFTVGSNRPPNMIEYRKFKDWYRSK